MTGFVYAAMMIYTILGVGVVAFLVWVGPALLAELWEYLTTSVEWVERMLLAIEEVREHGSVPGRHRYTTSGVHRPDETYFSDLIEEWKGLEDELRREIEVKVPANA